MTYARDSPGAGGEIRDREGRAGAEAEVSEENISAAVVLCLYLMNRGDDLVDLL